MKANEPYQIITMYVLELYCTDDTGYYWSGYKESRTLDEALKAKKENILRYPKQQWRVIEERIHRYLVEES